MPRVLRRPVGKLARRERLQNTEDRSRTNFLSGGQSVVVRGWHPHHDIRTSGHLLNEREPSLVVCVVVLQRLPREVPRVDGHGQGPAWLHQLPEAPLQRMKLKSMTGRDLRAPLVADRHDLMT
jgi:hypothetical protein